MDSAPTYVAAILSVKEKILKAAREKQEVMYKGLPMRLAAVFSMETLQTTRETQGILPSNENQSPRNKTTLSSKAFN